MKNKVKVFLSNEDEDWVDFGVGFASLKNGDISVVDEEGIVIAKYPVNVYSYYEIQDDKLIVWNEPVMNGDDIDVGICFIRSDDCKVFWKNILKEQGDRQKQKQREERFFKMDLDDFLGEDIAMPVCDIGQLEIIESVIDDNFTPGGKSRIAKALLKDEYLFRLFDVLIEKSESIVSNRFISKILCLNHDTIIRSVTSEHIFFILLELMSSDAMRYNDMFENRDFQMIVPIEGECLDMIHYVYRLEFLQNIIGNRTEFDTAVSILKSQIHSSEELITNHLFQNNILEQMEKMIREEKVMKNRELQISFLSSVLDRASQSQTQAHLLIQKGIMNIIQICLNRENSDQIIYLASQLLMKIVSDNHRVVRVYIMEENPQFPTMILEILSDTTNQSILIATKYCLYDSLIVLLNPPLSSQTPYQISNFARNILNENIDEILNTSYHLESFTDPVALNLFFDVITIILGGTDIESCGILFNSNFLLNTLQLLDSPQKTFQCETIQFVKKLIALNVDIIIEWVASSDIIKIILPMLVTINNNLLHSQISSLIDLIIQENLESFSKALSKEKHIISSYQNIPIFYKLQQSPQWNLRSKRKRSLSNAAKKQHVNKPSLV